MRRRAIVLCLASAFLAGLLAVLGANLPRGNDPIPQTAISSVRVGMSLEEITEAIGVPPGNYSGHPDPIVVTWYEWKNTKGMGGNDLRMLNGGEEWIGKVRSIYVRFDEQGLADEIRIGKVIRYEPPLFDRVRSILGLPDNR
jgi:hypothetical protein